jgi:hypothetical protein
MKYIIVFLVFFNLISNKICGQTVNKVYHVSPNSIGAWGRAIVQYDVDSFLITSSAFIGNNYYAKGLFLKVNSQGDTASTIVYSGIDTQSYIFSQSNLLKKGSFFYTCLTSYIKTSAFTTYSTIKLFKLNSKLDTVFVKNYTGLWWQSVIGMYDYGSGLLLTGKSSINTNANAELSVLNIDYAGNIKWQKYFAEDAQLSYYGFNTVNAPNKGFITTCLSDIDATIPIAYNSIYRLDSNGNKIWKKTFWKNINSYVVRIREKLN